MILSNVKITFFQYISKVFFYNFLALLFVSKVYSYTYNPNSIVYITDSHGKILCTGTIYSDNYVFSSDYCLNDHPIDISFVENHKYHIAVKSFKILHQKSDSAILIKSVQKFDPSDILAFQIISRNLPKKIVSDPVKCKEEYFVNEKVNENNERIQSTAKDVMFDPHTIYSLQPLTPNNYFNSLENYNWDHFFIWKICNDFPVLSKIYSSSHQYFVVNPFYKEIFNAMKQLSFDSDAELNVTSFITLPINSDTVVKEFITEIVKAKWIKNEKDKLDCIPFKSADMINPCANKLLYMQKYLHLNPRLKVKFGKLFIYCKDDIGCLKIIDTIHYDHIALVYQSQETQNTMIVDPAVSKKSFELSAANIRKYYLNRSFNVHDTGYFIISNNLVFFLNNFWFHYQLTFTDEDFIGPTKL